jgi:hypothetical protein
MGREIDTLVNKYAKILYELCELRASNPDSVWESAPYAQYVQLRRSLDFIESDIVQFLRQLKEKPEKA